MASRQFARLTIQELEKLFDEKRTNADTLSSILAELAHRKTSRAKALNCLELCQAHMHTAMLGAVPALAAARR